ncbi:hypothetical protein FJZ26_02285 [Candidatus Parvarchaeota archaeon]|nr:hypothetical protein [Candidatus Parvarchaeota archaeon]
MSPEQKATKEHKEKPFGISPLLIEPSIGAIRFKTQQASANTLKVDLSRQKLDGTVKGKAEAGLAPNESEIVNYTGEQAKLIDAYQKQVGQLVSQYEAEQKSNPLARALESMPVQFGGGSTSVSQWLMGAYEENIGVAKQLSAAIESGQLKFDNDTDRLAAFRLIETYLQAAKNALFAQLDFINPELAAGQKSIVSGIEATGKEQMDFLLEKMSGGKLSTGFVAEYFKYKAGLAVGNAQLVFEESREQAESQMPNRANIDKAHSDAKRLAGEPTEIRNRGDLTEWVEGYYKQMERLNAACSRVYSHYNIVETRWFGEMREDDWQDRKAYIGTLGNVSAIGLDLFGGPLGKIIAKWYFSLGIVESVKQKDYFGAAAFAAALFAGDIAGTIKGVGRGAAISRQALGAAGMLGALDVMYNMGKGMVLTAQDLAYFGFTPQGTAALVDQLANAYAAARGGHKGKKAFEKNRNIEKESGVEPSVKAGNEPVENQPLSSKRREEHEGEVQGAEGKTAQKETPEGSYETVGVNDKKKVIKDEVSSLIEGAFNNSNMEGQLLIDSQLPGYFSKGHVPKLLELAQRTYAGFKVAANAIRNNPELFADSNLAGFIESTFKPSGQIKKEMHFNMLKNDEMLKTIDLRPEIFKPEHFEIFAQGAIRDARNLNLLLTLERRSQENPQMHEAGLAAFEKVIGQNHNAAANAIGALLYDVVEAGRADWSTLPEALKRGTLYPPDMTQVLIEKAQVLKVFDGLSEDRQAAIFMGWLLEGKSAHEKMNAVQRNLEAIVEIEAKHPGRTRELIDKDILTFWKPNGFTGVN